MWHCRVGGQSLRKRDSRELADVDCTPHLFLLASEINVISRRRYGVDIEEGANQTVFPWQYRSLGHYSYCFVRLPKSEELCPSFFIDNICSAIMVAIVGKYQHERNENIDEYFKDLGVPYLARKMMAVSHPTLEISQEGDKWTIKNITLMSTLQCTFDLGSEYEETMPSGDKIKSVTTVEGDSLVTISTNADGNKIVRRYDFSDDQVILRMSQEKSDQVAKRYYKRMPQ